MSLISMRDRAIGHLNENNPEAAFDPAIIVVIFDIIKSFIQMFQDCNTSSENAVRIAKDPSFFQKRLINMKVRRELGFKMWRQHGQEVVKSILHTGKDTTVEEMEVAYEDSLL